MEIPIVIMANSAVQQSTFIRTQPGIIKVQIYLILFILGPYIDPGGW
jgi:hypothetical protein